MISLDRVDRVLCDCCGDDMGQILGGVPTTAGAICDHTKAPHFAVCPDCNFARDELAEIAHGSEYWP